jgi:hypothetical protein
MFSSRHQEMADSDVAVSLPRLPPPDDPEFAPVLEQHITLCTADGCTGAAGDAHRRRKEKSLRDLFFLLQGPDSGLIKNDQRFAIFDMLMANVSRPDPVFPTVAQTSYYTIDLVEPYWATLNLAYDLFQRFMRTFSDFESLNMHLVKRLMFLTQLPDHSERHAIQAVLAQYFDGHPHHRSQFLSELTYHLVLLQQDLSIPLSGVTLLALTRQLVPLGRARHHAELGKVLMVGVIPLLKSEWFSVFARSFSSVLCEDVCLNWPAFSIAVIKTMQSHWPRTSPGKLQCFAQLLMQLGPLLPDEALAFYLPIVMRFLVKLIVSSNLLALKHVLPGLGTPEWRKLFVAVSSTIQKELTDALLDLGSRHWDSTIREIARALREKCAADAKADGRGRSISASKTLGMLATLAPDKFFEG